jgi:hypothetical protein
MRHSPLALVLAALAIAAPLSARAAQFKVTTWADSRAVLGTGAGNILVDDPAPDAKEATSDTPGVSLSSSSGASLTNLWDGGSAAWNGAGNAQAMVDTAGIHLFASGLAEVVDSQPFFGHTARGDGIAYGEFTDTFVLQANGVATGTFLRVRAEIVVDALLTASANDVSYDPSTEEAWGGASWIVTAKVTANGSTQLDTFFRFDDCFHRLLTSPDAYCPPSSRRQVVVFSVPVGGVTEVRLSGNAQASGFVTQYDGGNGSAAGSGDLGNTVGWGGVLELQTNEGEPVTDFSMLSEATGIDYRFPQSSVPEPGALGLGLVALAMLSARALHRSPSN